MDKVTISNLQGETGLVNVVRYFLHNATEYLIYSLNEVDEAGYTRLYVTKISGVDGMYNADTLNDTEWAEIKNLVKVIVKANKENMPVPVQDINPKKITNITLKDKKIFKLNTPLVNDLAANKPNFNDTNDNDETSSNGAGEQKSVFDTPNTPVFETPTQPTFDIPNTPAFDAPTQPTFDMPNTPAFDAPTQPTFDIPNTPAFETPTQPTFDIPSTSSFDAPVQPTFDIPSTTSNNNNQNTMNFGTFDFGATSSFTEAQPTNTQTFDSNSKIQEMQSEIERLNEEISKYKDIIANIKNMIEK